VRPAEPAREAQLSEDVQPGRSQPPRPAGRASGRRPSRSSARGYGCPATAQAASPAGGTAGLAGSPTSLCRSHHERHHPDGRPGDQVLRQIGDLLLRQFLASHALGEHPDHRVVAQVDERRRPPAAGHLQQIPDEVLGQLSERGDQFGAEQCYRKAIEAGNTDAMLNLGAFLSRHGDDPGIKARSGRASAKTGTRLSAFARRLPRSRGAGRVRASRYLRAGTRGRGRAVAPPALLQRADQASPAGGAA
jgi:hypothetical protein